VNATDPAAAAPPSAVHTTRAACTPAHAGV
jgi:hypothetical protein